MSTFILPIETAARELDAKLLLAVQIAARGGVVIVGSHARINNRLHVLPVRAGDVYVSQTIIRAKRRLFGILAKMGLRIAAWDEEGFVWRSAEFYRHRRLDAANFRRLVRFYAWGEQQAAVVRRAFPDLAASRLVVTGNPRQDLLAEPFRPLFAETAATLRREFGDYILVNSNFGSLNHARDPHPKLEKSEAELEAIAARSIHDLGYIRFRYRIFRSFLDLLPALSEALSDHVIVVRPHPSENPAVWEMAARGLANVIVRYEHDLVPWLMAARAIIHNGCTTAIEAALLGRPVIEYRLEENAEWENPQPAAVSIPARSPDEVIRLVREGMPAMERAAVEAALSDIMFGWNDGLASARIAEDLMRIIEEPCADPPVIVRLTGLAASAWRGAEKWLTGRLVPSKSANPAYIDKKFPPMAEERVQARLARLAGLADLPVPRLETLGDRIWRVVPS